MSSNWRGRREEKLQQFDPNLNGLQGHGLFGLPFEVEDAGLVLLPVPWEVTVSYRAGTAKAPQAILEASQQIDLHDYHHPHTWREGIAMDEVPEQWLEKSNALRPHVERYIARLEAGEAVTDADGRLLEEVNRESEYLHEWVEGQALHYLQDGRLVGLIGGDHSTPLGLIRALAKEKGQFSILQIDAHADLREAYEGFTYSHASIMHNVREVGQLAKLVQVGIRDISKGEAEVMEKEQRLRVWYDAALQARQFSGTPWAETCREIIEYLHEQVYISFDIDGLEPSFCPNTGTPVPGGLSFAQAAFLIEEVVMSGRTIIGFDLCEVSPGSDDWDANVGARLLYRLSLAALASQQ